MSFVTAAPEVMVAAGGDMAAIGSAINTANAAATASTTGVVTMAADEASAEIETLFRAHAEIYRELSAQAAASYGQVVRALAASASSYAAVEVANYSPPKVCVEMPLRLTGPVGHGAAN